MASKKRELYEILAEKNRKYSLESDSQILPGEVESAVWREDSSIIASPGNAPIQETREYADPKPEEVKSGELIIDFNMGMVALLIVLMMFGTAAYLGYQAGMRDEVNRLQTRMREEEKDISVGSASLENGVREERSISLLWPADTLVLRLISFNMTAAAEWTKALDTLNYAKAQPMLAETGLEVHVMADGNAYYVVIGPFKSRNDPQLKKVQDAFRTLKGPRTTTGYGQYPYDGAYPERFVKLGKVVE